MHFSLKTAALLTAFLFFTQVPVPAAARSKKAERLTEAEDRARLVEDDLEVQPFKVVYLGRKHVLRSGQAAIGVVLTVTNLTGSRAGAFSGKLVFRMDDGYVYVRPIYYPHPIGAGKTVRLTVAISVDETKSYTEFLKARSIKVVLVDQKLL